ncbi:MAG: hypothetical protein LBT03_00080 [Holosporales bacterium]|jgi:hypothetical protein|nr:hypothetical protein [Holosporales bacterium]
MFGRVVFVVSALVVVGNCFAAEETVEGVRDKFGRVPTGAVDPLDEYQNLSPRGKFTVACELLDRSSETDRLIGARLLISAALTDKNSDALEMLKFECKIANDKDSAYISKCYTLEDLIKAISAKHSCFVI